MTLVSLLKVQETSKWPY